MIAEHINKSGTAVVFVDDDGRAVKMTIADMIKLRKENERLWKALGLMADYVKKSPCDPDITETQIKAYKEMIKNAECKKSLEGKDE